ncbi:MAG: hypothetical protein A2741_02875 [Candidatus Zambryskibacteria bacterium RIFCSPHIGHO2_01_FULL_43_27]|uniref:Endolytic murein transglycosylase n=1 Tax=Candidatus Zambryskibacteria bacterium RIFCSPLOWO2_01_FULL_43_17 TaxID=1802760 RepID=A0A1G2U4E9_9BACT|nr:MAG: hypothetical protein A2741_02875 [Candidatus Zambryskibacteria bacterium RIFCSPHIGHO2_01_FULL_43_27]OHB00759.1 MAG: hypothetical protein A3E93_02935 [Candidatus Zambryskibacteria bacterium RIFCSPHIGHO2_12_FULL_43_12b]OHB04365.1 MAG: hypothetical protein A2920_00475 [Candidatus Zambryskibacteria bacterium RIFCSPLOWO2_01_FULL_43_17]
MLSKIKQYLTPALFKDKYLEMIFVLVLVCVIINIFFISAPVDFPLKKTVRIEKGAGMAHVAESLKEMEVTRGTFWLKVFITLLGGPRSVREGDYYLPRTETSFDIAKRIVNADYELDSLRVTIPESFSNVQIAELLKSRFSLFDGEEFIKSAPEGYLFPDTYLFLPNISAEGVVEIMKLNFDNKIIELKEQIENSKYSLNEIITLASIIEEEAIKEEDRKIVSGILQTRLKIGMALQVDATFAYINGKNTYALTHDDLRKDSPYNLYTNVGLPPTPISNPGIESIKAVLEPINTDYLYFLSDLNGNVYYAKNFDEHQANREKYLRK